MAGSTPSPKVVAPDCHDHDPAPGQHMGPEGYKAFFTELRTAFPDMQVEVKKLVADGDSVAFAYTLTGTHQGDFNGHKPTGRPSRSAACRSPFRRRQDGRAVGVLRRARHPEADRRHRGLMEASAKASRPRDVLGTWPRATHGPPWVSRANRRLPDSSGAPGLVGMAALGELLDDLGAEGRQVLGRAAGDQPPCRRRPPRRPRCRRRSRCRGEPWGMRSAFGPSRRRPRSGSRDRGR